MRRLWSNLFTLAAAFAVLGLVAMLWARSAFNEPGPATTPIVIDVPRGANLPQIARTLEETGAISNAGMFIVVTRALDLASDLKAGEYEIPARASMAEVLDRITEGRALQHRLTVVEGLTVREVVAMLNASEVVTGVIERTPLEGTLAPDTYFLGRGEERQAVLDRMQEAQSERLERLWRSRADNLPFETQAEALILASIVEKETGVASERRRVASVFINRLRRGMRLQSDPTVIYGVTGGAGPLGRPITRSDLDTPTPFNTYTIPALPPTPIANPGEASIAATLNPEETDYLFFVADGTGGHAFTKTYDEHRREVARWREIERERRAAGSDG